MKYFIGAHIEDPHLCYYAAIENDPYFDGCWSWADKDGMPEKGKNVVFFLDFDDAKEMADELQRTGGGIPHHADTIRVVALDV